MLKNRYLLLLAYIGIVLCVLVFGMSTYAYVTVSLGEEDDPIDIKTYDRNVEVNYVDTSNVSMVNAYTGQKIVKTFYIENNSEGVAYYDIILENVINDFANKEDLIYNIKSDNNGAVIYDSVLPSEDITLASNIKIDVGEKQTYEMTINFLKTDEDQNENMNRTFSSNINVIASKNVNAGEYIYKDNTLLKEIVTNAKGNTDIKDFNDNIDGIYYTNNSINGNTTYFYRGSNNLNNNVVIGNLCYKIIRTSENYGIKLLYSGKYENNKCNNIELGDKVAYNTFSNYNAYVGYMYGNVSSDNYEAEHKNISSSDIKKYLDVWYNTNIKDYEELIDTSSIYCNNRTMSAFKYNNILYNLNGYSNLNTGYLLMNNYFIKNDKKLLNYNCNIDDRFSVNNEFGNNKLNYPIALLTIEEAYFAGLDRNKPNNNFLASDYDYMTMTPAYFNGQDAYNFVITKNKVIPSKVSNLYYVRPVITIKKDTKILSGNGTLDEPYILAEAKVIETEESDEE